MNLLNLFKGDPIDQEMDDTHFDLKFRKDPEGGFHQNWQKASETEESRTGDCEDYMIYLAQKIYKRTGQIPVFKIGRYHKDSKGNHAYMEWDVDGKTYILDPVKHRRKRLKEEWNKRGFYLDGKEYSIKEYLDGR